MSLRFVKKLDGNADALAGSGRHDARYGESTECRFDARKKARGDDSAKHPVQHARRYYATAKTQFRLFLTHTCADESSDDVTITGRAVRGVVRD